MALLALKCDLREDPDAARGLRERGYPKGTLSYEDGLDVAKRIRAVRYMGKPQPRDPFNRAIRRHC